MEDNKKGQNEDHVKIYDKEMYISQEKLRTIIIGFIAGYFSKDIIKEELKTLDTNNVAITNNEDIII